MGCKMNGHQRQPRYFHLLWDEDLDELRDVLVHIRDRRGEVISHWYKLYCLHFGDQRTLSRSEFERIFEAALLRNQEALLRKDMDGYAASVLTMGRQLVEQHVPLEELIAAVQLFEDAAQAVFPQEPPPTTAVYTKFDKLSHIRIILLVGAYVRLQGTSATRIHTLEVEARNLPPRERTRFHGLVGHSAEMRELYTRMEGVEPGGHPLLIVGERGTGKQLLARAIHQSGIARDGPFASLKCGLLPSYLIESELFGYQGAGSNGNQATYLGLYRAAEGGTLYVDEVTAMPSEVQSKLLRAIEKPRSDSAAGVRVIASTNSDPHEAVRSGRLRDELYQRLQHTILRIAPLRERLVDVPLLVEHFIDMLNERTLRQVPTVGIDESALQALERYSWPGNVQELSDAVENAFGCAKSAVIGLGDLPTHISGVNGASGVLPTISFETFADAERGVLQRALEITGGNKVQAARLLKISRKKLYSGIAKYGLKSVNA
jgi:DNA-binding NtrC family response regulator